MQKFPKFSTVQYSSTEGYKVQYSYGTGVCTQQEYVPGARAVPIHTPHTTHPVCILKEIGTDSSSFFADSECFSIKYPNTVNKFIHRLVTINKERIIVNTI